MYQMQQTIKQKLSMNGKKCLYETRNVTSKQTFHCTA